MFLTVVFVVGCASYEPRETEPEPSVKVKTEKSKGGEKERKKKRQKMDVPEGKEGKEGKEQAEEKSSQPEVESQKVESKQRASASEKTKKITEKADKIEKVQAESRGNNVILTLKSRILFSMRSAKIRKSARPVLDEVAKLLLDYPKRMVMVCGHTDTLPTKTEKFPSNWDLSAQRAVNVVKYLSYLPGLDESRLIAAGFGEHHPVAPNDAPEQRRLNRRVEIMLLPPGVPQKQIQISR